MEIPFEKQAIQNEPPPKELIGIELLTYFSACYMYELYHANKITRDDGSKMKRQIVDASQSATASEIKYSGISARLEREMISYAQNRTIESADKLHAAVGNMPDDWRLKR